MSEQDNKQYSKILEEHERLSKDFHQEHLRLGMENIRQKRELVHLFIIVSSGIIGTLLIFEKSNLIKNINFVVIGSIFFLLVIIYGFYYLTKILTKEGNVIDEFAKVFFNELELVRKSYKEYFADMKAENWSNIENSQKEALKQINSQSECIEKDDKKFSFGLYIIFGLFLIGLVFLFLSIIDFKVIIGFLKVIILKVTK